MLHRHHRAKDGQRKVTPPGPTSMSHDQVASYLKDLRTNRPARPSGSRPLPTKGAASTSKSNQDLPPRAASAMSTYEDADEESEKQSIRKQPPRAASALSNYNTPSSRFSFGSSAGRPLAQGPRTLPIRKNVTPSQFHRQRDVSPNTAYRESAQRRVEKEEARSLRDALEEMDHQDDERIHQAAQDEATELVWMHRNPDVPYKNPYAPYRNPDTSGSRRDSQKAGRSQRQSLGNQRGIVSGKRRSSHRFASDSSTDSHNGPNPGVESAYKKQGQPSLGEETDERRDGTPRKNLKVNFALPSEEESSKLQDSIEPRPRNVSNDSSKGVFRNPNDQIYEEPENPHSRIEDDRPVFARSDPSALRTKPRNSLLKGSRPLPNRSSNPDFARKFSRFEVHKNPPTQTRNPQYKMNESHADADSGRQDEEDLPTKDGVEIRGDDIRAATSKRLKDRSDKLPMPSAVSDRAGRPIVSFDQAWKPGDAQPKPSRDSFTRHESASPNPPPQPSAPSIQVSEAPPVPVINLPDDEEPTISEMKLSSRPPGNSRGPLPDPKRNMPRRDTSPKKAASASRDTWYSPYSRAGVPTAKCESCSLPIAGQIVTAAGTRLHPECFLCSHCQTPLECVAFYQEPETKRDERLAEAASDDEEAQALRFYCHLDFHELFSPRCKSCKTPIEGEVVVACGAEWHVGHFFCAECGDPFDQRTPFVEKDGFAWCLQCHSKRTAPRCLRCRQPVMEDVVITAVGGQWHDKCFTCHECGTGLGSDGRYFVKEGEPRRTAKGRIIGGPVQLAVCESIAPGSYWTNPNA